MKKVLAIVVVIVILLGGIGISNYNSLITSQQAVEQGLSNIDTVLQRRMDLIPNLVNTVKGYAAHESEVIQSVSDARAQLAGASTVADKAEADASLSSSLSRLLAVAENYPTLKADTQFTALTDELAGSENRIAQARNQYNDVVKEYNTSIKKFPKVIFANLLGFDSAEYFNASEGANEVPEVNF